MVNNSMPLALARITAEPPEPPKEVHLLAVDVEAAGSQLRYPTIAIEFCHCRYDPATSQMSQLDQRTFSVITTHDQFEPKCYDEYWSKHMDKFERLQQGAKSYEETARSVVAYVCNLMEKQPAIVFLSDNVSFDITRLNAFFENQNRLPVSYRPDNVYQLPIDLSSMARALAILKGTEDTWKSRDITSSRLYDEVRDNPPYSMCCKYIAFIDVLQQVRLKNGIHILGVDVKTAGAQLKYPTVSLGFCHSVYDKETHSFNFLHMKRFNFKVTESEFEPSCWKECWQYRQEALKTFQETAKPHDEAAKDVVAYMEALFRQYPDIQVVSDNLSFDVERLNCILSSQGKEPISYRPDGKYQTPVDLTQIEASLAIIKSTRDPWERFTSHEHLAATLEPKNNLPVEPNRTPDRAAFLVTWRYAKCMDELAKYKLGV